MSEKQFDIRLIIALIFTYFVSSGILSLLTDLYIITQFFAAVIALGVFIIYRRRLFNKHKELKEFITIQYNDERKISINRKIYYISFNVSIVVLIFVASVFRDLNYAQIADGMLISGAIMLLSLITSYIYVVKIKKE